MPHRVEDVVAVVLRDVVATSPLGLLADPAPFTARHRGDGVLLSVTGHGQLGVIVSPSGTFDENLLEAADMIQDWIVDSLPGQGHPAVWPECPDHPGTHPLRPIGHLIGPVWACPESRRVIAPVGSLPNLDRALASNHDDDKTHLDATREQGDGSALDSDR